MRSRALGCLLLACFFTACREPASVEQFLPGEGPFTFPVSMTDTAAVYDFDFSQYVITKGGTFEEAKVSRIEEATSILERLTEFFNKHLTFKK